MFNVNMSSLIQNVVFDYFEFGTAVRAWRKEGKEGALYWFDLLIERYGTCVHASCRTFFYVTAQWDNHGRY